MCFNSTFEGVSGIAEHVRRLAAATLWFAILIKYVKAYLATAAAHHIATSEFQASGSFGANNPQGG